MQQLIEKLRLVMNSSEKYTLEMQKQLEWVKASNQKDYFRFCREFYSNRIELSVLKTLTLF